jgi:TPR repeat protein
MIPEPAAGTEAHIVYERAVSGDTGAITELACAHCFGSMGLTQDFAIAVELYRIAVAAGDTKAMVRLGTMHMSAVGVPKDLAEARRLFEMAADKGDVNAQDNLGFLYFIGWGVPVDLAKSRQLIQPSAEKGNTATMFKLASMPDRGMGGPVDSEGAAHWYLRAAREGDVQFQHFLLSKYVRDLKSETRMAIQRRLRDVGHYSRAIDGIFGDKTLAALRAFVGPLKPIIDDKIIEALARMEKQRKERQGSSA